MPRRADFIQFLLRGAALWQEPDRVGVGQVKCHSKQVSSGGDGTSRDHSKFAMHFGRFSLDWDDAIKTELGDNLSKKCEAKASGLN